MDIWLKFVYFSPFRDYRQISLNLVMNLGRSLSRRSPSPSAWVAALARRLQVEGPPAGRAAIATHCETNQKIADVTKR